MKNLFLVLMMCYSVHHVQAQQTVHISGQIDQSSSAEIIYLGLDHVLFPLTTSSDGTFSIDGSVQQFPSFFYFANISKRGKIEHQTPLIWFQKDSVTVKLNWTDKTFQMQDMMPFQSTSEKIEKLKGNEQIEFILNNPNSLPSLYFVNKNKEKILITDLEKFSLELDEEFKNSNDSKRIETYVSAKKRKTLKKGMKVEDFKLPNEEGQLISVIDKSNKTKLIALFSSGCSFSIASIGLLEQLTDLNDDKLEIVTIWDDQTKDDWLNSHHEKKSRITWTNLWDEYGFASAYLNRTMWPTFLIVSSDGVLIDIVKGYNQKTAKKLKALLQ